jgi:hypothetical protein
MIYFKSCARCKGDVFLDKDWYGEYLKCLQCGHTRDLSTPQALLQPMTVPVESEPVVVKRAS